MALCKFLIKFVNPKTDEVETTEASFCNLQAKTPEEQAEDYAEILAEGKGYKVMEKVDE